MGSYSNGLQKPVLKMSEAEFLSRRIMFCAVRQPGMDQVRVADPSDNRNHRAWMSDLSEAVFRTTPRGYALDGRLVFYQNGFEFVGLRAIADALPELVSRLDLPPTTQVYTGGIMGPNDVILGRERVGTICDIQSRYGDTG